MKTEQLEKVVNVFSKNWLGKNGIEGIEFKNENQNGELIIYANLDKLIYDKIPNVYKGLRTTIKPIGEISVLVK